MAEHVYRGSNGNISPVGNDIARPSTSDEPKLALTMPDRKTQRHDAIEGWKSASLKRSFNLVRPSTAPLGLRGVPKVSPKAPNLSRPTRVFGKLSLFDAEIDKEAHSYLGPKVLRDMGEPRLGFALQSPDNFLKVGDGQSLRTRVAMKELLKKYPVNRDPPFRKGNGGVRLSWQSVPMAASLFRYLYDNGTIDFISMRWTNTGNEAVWGCKEKSGRVHWGQRPVDVEIARWLPIFLEGIREYQEPYRFLAIMGSHDLIEEASQGHGRLLQCAADLVPPLKKALDSREPSAVTVAVELMKNVLKADPEVGRVWIRYLGQFSQPLNLFLSRGYWVDMGYADMRQVKMIKTSINELLVQMHASGGNTATSLFRRYMRVDPPVTDQAMKSLRKKAEEKPGFGPWKPYTLI